MSPKLVLEVALADVEHKRNAWAEQAADEWQVEMLDRLFPTRDRTQPLHERPKS